MTVFPFFLLKLFIFFSLIMRGCRSVYLPPFLQTGRVCALLTQQVERVLNIMGAVPSPGLFMNLLNVVTDVPGTNKSVPVSLEPKNEKHSYQYTVVFQPNLWAKRKNRCRYLTV